MLDQSPERWANFQRKVEELQKTAAKDVQYKVLILGRHGQGWHNYASDKYGVDVSPCVRAPLESSLSRTRGGGHVVAKQGGWTDIRFGSPRWRS